MKAFTQFLAYGSIAMCVALSGAAYAASETYATDDAHNHDGSHSAPPDTTALGRSNCGTNFMQPETTARLGSHSFIILGQTDEHHILADHRSGTPPHNYQFILRIRLDDDEMALYQRLRQESATPPAFTTIYFDDANTTKQLDRSFFCLDDLPKIFGNLKRTDDGFESLFPIRASLQKNADFEGNFEIGPTIYPGGHFTLQRDDVELVLYRYLPSYLEQQSFRKSIQDNPVQIVPRLHAAPLYATEAVQQAAQHHAYAQTDGAIADKKQLCPRDVYLKNVDIPQTIHTFVLLAALDSHTLLAVHYYDQAPHNFQTVLHLRVNDAQMNIYREAVTQSSSLPLLQTRVVNARTGQSKNDYFCMAQLKSLIKNGTFHAQGTVYKNSKLDDYQLGETVGSITLDAKNVDVITNRYLPSLLNPLAVAKDVLGHRFTALEAP